MSLIASFFPIIFIVMFTSILGIWMFTLGKGIKQWSKNNASPVLTVEAAVVSRRTNVSHHHSADSNEMMHTSSTHYYVTFQVESGDRMELAVDGSEYGMLVEGDFGKLTFQGTRYLGFERKR